MTITRRRAMRVLGRLLIAATAVVAALVCWALFWPPPGGAHGLHCRPAELPGCESATGRVVYAPRKDRADPTRPLHLVLVSRDSTALPLVSVVKIPASLRPREAPGVGRWVSVVGTPHRGSNGETDIGVRRLLLP